MSPSRTYLNEGDVKEEVKKILTKHDWYWWMPPANGFGKSNVDFNALRGGVFMAVETKFGANKATPLQIGFLQSVMAESGFGFLVTEKTLEHFRAWVEAFDRAAQATMQRGGQPTAEDGAILINAVEALTAPIVMAKPRKKRNASAKDPGDDAVS